MSSEYTGDDASFPETIIVPDDGEDEDAVSVGVPLEGLADQIAYLRMRHPKLKMQVFTASGTWTAPARCTVAILSGYGGGGGGGSGSNGITTADRWVAGGGGGGGSLRGSAVVAVTPETTYNIDIGAGGAAPLNASDPGDDGGGTVFRESSTELARFAGGGGGRGAVNHVIGLFEHYVLGGVPYPAATRINIGAGGGNIRYDTSDTMWAASNLLLTLQPAQGGFGADGSGHPSPSAGQRNPTSGYAGGAAGTRGPDLSTARGGGAGGGGGAGPGGVGGAGGGGGDAGGVTGAGIAGSAAAANTGAGGGGGGSSSYRSSSPSNGALGGAGGSGKLTVVWVEEEDGVDP